MRATETVVSTALVHPNDQFDYWCAVVRDNLAGIQHQCETRIGFNGSLRRRSLSWLDVLQITTATPHIAMRLRAPLGAPSDDYYFASLGLWGTGLGTQDGRDAWLKWGVLLLEDGSLPYQFKVSGAETSHLLLRIPRALLQQRVSHVDQLILGRGVIHNSELVGLMANLAASTLRLGQLDPLIREQLAHQTLDLLATVLMQSANPRGTDLNSGRIVTLWRVKSLVERYLHDPELSPTKIATALGISSRYINKLFEDENTSLMRYVWDRRLERCRCDLEDAAHTAGISQVAFHWGFNDLSHFSRAFKAQFGLSPREYLRLNSRSELLKAATDNSQLPKKNS
jgi:AraC-like DNA-binding protein